MRRRRRVRRRAAGCTDGAAGSGEADLGWRLVPFGAACGLRCVSILLSLDISRSLRRASQGFSAPAGDADPGCSSFNLGRVSHYASLCVCCCPQVLIHTIILTILSCTCKWISSTQLARSALSSSSTLHHLSLQPAVACPADLEGRCRDFVCSMQVVGGRDMCLKGDACT